MVERNNEIVVVDWKEDLKSEAKVQCLAVANNCLESLKQSSSEYAKFAVDKFFEQLINYINSR